MAEAKFKLGVDISQWVAGLSAGQKALQKFSNVTVKVSKDFYLQLLEITLVEVLLIKLQLMFHNVIILHSLLQLVDQVE